MTFSSSIVLLFALIAMAALPSASVALVVTRSATAGFPSGVAVAAGIVLGDLVFIALAVLGMSFLAEAMGSFFFVLKCLGGLYLIWLGLNLIRSSGECEIAVGGTGRRSLLVSFSAGFLLTLGDVKAILFYASLFPAFVDIDGLATADFGKIVLVTVVAVGGVKVAYACAAQGFIRRFHSGKARKWISTAAGVCLTGAGGYLIVKG